MDTLNDILKESLKEKKAVKNLNNTATTKQQQDLVSKYTGVSSAAAKNIVNNANANNVASKTTTNKATTNKTVFDKVNDFLNKYFTTKGVESLDDSSKFKQFSQKADQAAKGTNINLNTNANNDVTKGDYFSVAKDAAKGLGYVQDKATDAAVNTINMPYKFAGAQTDLVNKMFGANYENYLKPVYEGINKAISNFGEYNVNNSKTYDDHERKLADRSFNELFDTKEVQNKLKKNPDYTSSLFNEDGTLIDYTSKLDELKEKMKNPYTRASYQEEYDALKDIVKDQEAVKNTFYIEYLKSNGATEDELYQAKSYLLRENKMNQDGLQGTLYRATNDLASTIESWAGNKVAGIEAINERAFYDLGLDYEKNPLTEYVIQDSEMLQSQVMNSTEGAEKFIYDTYNGMSSFIYDLATMTVLGGGNFTGDVKELQKLINGKTLLLSDVGVLGSKYRENIANGYDVETSFNNAVFYAEINHLTEMIGGEALVGVVSSAFGAEMVKTAWFYGVQLLKQAAAEGIEEGMSAALEPFADIATLGTDMTVEDYLNTVFSKDTGYSMLVGAVGGLAMGAGGAAYGASQYNEYVQTLKDSITIDGMKDYNFYQALVGKIDDLSKTNNVNSDIELGMQVGALKQAYIEKLREYKQMNPSASAFIKESDQVDTSKLDATDEFIASSVRPNIASSLEDISNLKAQVEEQSQIDVQNIQNTLDSELKGTKIDAVEFANLSPEAQQNAISIANVIDNLGMSGKTIIANITSANGELIDGCQVGDYYVVNPNAELGVLNALMHEYTHGTESTQYYEIIKEITKQTFGDKYDDEVKRVIEGYKTVTDLSYEQAEKEVVAMFIGKNLGNQEFVDRLVRYNTSLAYKLYENIKMANQNTGGRLENIEYAFLRAFDKLKDVENKDLSLSYYGGVALNRLRMVDNNLYQKIEDNLNIAKSLENNGVDKKDIYYNTGFFKGSDGKWRFELFDDYNYVENAFNSKGKGTYNITEFYKPKSPAFILYPELKNIKVEITGEGKGKTRGSYQASKDLIKIYNSADFTTIVHETQHAIQRIEQFNRGSNKKFEKFYQFENAIIDVYRAIKNKDMSLLDSSIKHLANAIDKNYAPASYYYSYGEVEARDVQERATLDKNTLNRIIPKALEDDVAYKIKYYNDNGYGKSHKTQNNKNITTPDADFNDSIAGNHLSDIKNNDEENGNGQHRLVKFSKSLDSNNYAQVKENFNANVNEIIDNSKNYNDAAVNLYLWVDSLDQNMKWFRPIQNNVIRRVEALQQGFRSDSDIRQYKEKINSFTTLEEVENERESLRNEEAKSFINKDHYDDTLTRVNVQRRWLDNIEKELIRKDMSGFDRSLFNSEELTKQQILELNQLRNIKYEYGGNNNIKIDAMAKDGDTMYNTTLTKDELKEYFGTEIANEIISTLTGDSQIYSYDNGINEDIYDDESFVNEVVKQAREDYGTTNNYNEVGYIDIDGKMIDFSGKRDGASGNDRTMDHREMNASGVSWYDYVKMGNIRVFPESGGFEIEKKPTEAQQKALIKFLQNNKVARSEGSFVGISKSIGKNNIGRNEVASLVYENGESPTQIMKDVMSYFKGDQIRFSKAIDANGKHLTENQAEAYKNISPLLRDEEGNIKRYYHGTQRGDRVGYEFKPERATAGPMSYFTDSKDVADGYSRGKEDTSIEYTSAYEAYTVDGKDLNDYYNNLSFKDKNNIKNKMYNIGVDDDDNLKFGENVNAEAFGRGTFDIYLRENRNNPLKAMFRILEDSGIEELMSGVLDSLDIKYEFDDPYASVPKTYEVYLNVTNPLDSTNIPDKLVNEFKSKAEELEDSFTSNGNIYAWDKNATSPMQWISMLEEDLKNGTTRAWTVIPDYVTDILKNKGYDGIVDVGGKNGGYGHQVVIPFYSNQIKDINNENPTSSSDIRYSIAMKDKRENGPFYNREFKTKKDQKALEKINNGEMLTEDEFYRVYMVHKANYGTDTNFNAEDFKDVSLTHGMAYPSASFRSWNSENPKLNNTFGNYLEKGDVDILVTNDYYDSLGAGRRPHISDAGYKPYPFEIVNIEYDNQPLYEAYKNGFAKAESSIAKGENYINKDVRDYGWFDDLPEEVKNDYLNYAKEYFGNDYSQDELNEILDNISNEKVANIIGENEVLDNYLVDSYNKYLENSGLDYEPKIVDKTEIENNIRNDLGNSKNIKYYSKAITFVLNKGNPNNEDGYTITVFKDGNPYGHTNYNSLDEAIKDMASNLSNYGYEHFDVETENNETVRFSKRLSLTDDRINALVDENEDKWGANQFLNHGKGKSYITYMSPKDYLKLTESEKYIQNYYNSTAQLDEYKGGHINIDDMAKRPADRSASYIYLKIDDENNVVGQEGRHRSAMLDRDGYEQIPVLIYDEYGDTNLDGQLTTINGWNLPTSVDVELTQINKANRQKILDKFGENNGDEIRFSKNIDKDVRINKQLQKLNNVELRKSSEVRKVLQSIANTGEIGTQEYDNFIKALQDTFSWEVEGTDINEDLKSFIKNNHYKVNMTSLGINADKFTKNKDRSSKGWGEVGGAKEMQDLRNKFKGILEFVDNTNLSDFSKRLGNNGKMAGGSKGTNTKGDGIDVIYNDIKESFGDILPETTDPMEMLNNIYEVMASNVEKQTQYDEEAYNQHKELYDAFFEDFKKNYNKEIIEEENDLESGILDDMLNQSISKRQEQQIENSKQAIIDNIPDWVNGYDTIKAEYPNFADSTLRSAVFEVLAYGELTPETYNAMANTLSSDFVYEGIDGNEKEAIDKFIDETMETFVNEAKFKAGETDRELAKRAIKQNNATGMKDVEGSYNEGLEGRAKDKQSAEYKAKLQKDYQPIVDSLIAKDRLTRETKGKKADAKISNWKTIDQNIVELANGDKELYDTLKQKIRYECLDNGAKTKTNVLKQAQNVIDKIKELGIREGTKEDIGLQYYLEQHTEKQRDDVSLETSVELPDGTKAIDKAAIEELKRNPYEKYTIDNLKKDFNYKMDNGKYAWENIVEASQLLRDSYDETIDKINKTQIDANGDVEGKEDAETWKMLVEVENAFTTLQSIKDEIRRNGSKESTQTAFEIAKANYNRLARQYNERINKDEKGDLTRRNLTPYRENYSHHIQRNNLINTIKNIKNAELAVPTELAGLSDFTNPNTAWASFSAAQEGGKYVPTGLGSYASYMSEAANVIAYNPVIVELRQFNKDIKNTAQGTTLNTLSEYLNDYCNMLAGKRNQFDRAAQKLIGAKSMKVIQALNSYAKGAALAGNIRSGLVQFANIPNGLGILQAEGGASYVQDVAKGMTSYIKAITNEGSSPMDQSAFLANRFFDFDTGEKSFTKSLKDASSFVLRAGDKVGAEVIWWSAYEQANRLGSDIDPVQYADDITRRAVAGRTKEDMAISMNSQVLNLLMPFQVENNNLYQTLKQEVKGKKFGAVMTYMVTAYLFNMIIKGITNGDDEVLPEFITPIIGELKKAMTEDIDVDQTMENIMLGEIGEFLALNPAGSQIAALTFGDNAETIFGDYNPSRYGMTNIGFSGLTNAAVEGLTGNGGRQENYKILEDLVAGYVKGGKQLTRTVGGLQSMGGLPKINGDDEVEVSPINYTKSGKVAYVNDQSNISDWIRASLFGKGSTSEAKKYYADKDYLTDKEKRIFDTLQSADKNAYDNYQQAKVINDKDDSTNLRDQLIEQGKYGSYKDTVTQAYASYLDEWYKADHEDGDTPKSWNQFANSYGITSEDLKQDTYGDFYEKYDVSEENQKVFADALEIENTVNALGKTISNSAATERRVAYEKVGIYDSILEYIEDNNLEYSDFGLTKTVVGYNSKQINNMLSKIGKEANYEGGTSTTETGSKSSSTSSKTSSKSTSTTSQKEAEKQKQKFQKAALAYMKAVNGNTNDVFSVLKNMTTMQDAKSNVEKIMKNAYKGK